MNKNFYPVKTKDGSIGLYNIEVDDIYHSSTGAYTEAMNKFVLPSGVLDYVKKNDNVRILDICYGLGYNSKAAVNEILKINPSCKVHIDCLEIDENVLALSTLINQKQIDINIQKYFNLKLFKNKKVKDKIKFLEKESSINEFVDVNLRVFYKLNSNTPLKYSKRPKKMTFLHNIYYRTCSIRNSSSIQGVRQKCNLSLNFFVQDAREAIINLKGKYNFIFHDGFTPSKLPTLWSVEFFSKLYQLLDDTGNITTYTNSAVVRSGFKEAGFCIGKTLLEDKSIGTTAYKNNHYIRFALNNIELGLLKTKAGIPYRDNNLCNTAKTIIENRNNEVLLSTKQGASSFLKSNGVKTTLKH